MTSLDFEKIIEKYHQALSEFHKGNPEPVLNMFSRREDVSLANPLGPAVRGRAKIVDTAKRAASNYRRRTHPFRELGDGSDP